MTASGSFRKIVVAVGDPAARTQAAVKKAAEIARRSKASLTLLHVFSSPYSLPSVSTLSSSDILRQVSRGWLKQLTRLALPLRARGLKVDCAVEWDYPIHEGIVRHVLKTAPDLLIAESHHHGRIARFLMTNTDWELIRHCPCPLWFVKSATLSKNPAIIAAIDPFHVNAKPQALDAQIIAVAKRLKGQLDGHLALAHACNIPPVLTSVAPLDVMPIPASAQEIHFFEQRARQAMTRIARKHRVSAGDQIVEVAAPVAMLEQLVRKRNADLVVMGAVSRSGLRRAIIGSTAEDLIDSIACDVLIVKPKGFRTPVLRKRAAVSYLTWM